jgi:ketosteroid isomerase-like protein
MKSSATQTTSTTSITADDHLAILDLISEYSRSFDSGDVATFAGLFTPDGKLTTPVGNAETREEVLAWAQSRWQENRAAGIRPQHFQTNTLLMPVTHDRVTGTTQLLLIWVTAATGAAEIKGVATYVDEFHNTHDGWRFDKRHIGWGDATEATS